MKGTQWEHKLFISLVIHEKFHCNATSSFTSKSCFRKLLVMHWIKLYACRRKTTLVLLLGLRLYILFVSEEKFHRTKNVVVEVSVSVCLRSLIFKKFRADDASQSSYRNNADVLFVYSTWHCTKFPEFHWGLEPTIPQGGTFHYGHGTTIDHQLERNQRTIIFGMH